MSLEPEILLSSILGNVDDDDYNTTNSKKHHQGWLNPVNDLEVCDLVFTANELPARFELHLSEIEKQCRGGY